MNTCTHDETPASFMGLAGTMSPSSRKLSAQQKDGTSNSAEVKYQVSVISMYYRVDM